VVVVMVGFQTFPGRTKPCNPVFAKMQKKKKKKKERKGSSQKAISTNTTPMIRLS
jgi:hypothetical protein